MLDNHFVIRRAIRVLREEFPADFERRLAPLAGTGDLAGLPRIYAFGRDILIAEPGAVDREALAREVRAYQESRGALSIAELWALPTVLRLVVVERLADAAARILPSGDDATSGGEDEEVARTIAGAVRSLRTIEIVDWKRFFEDLSETESILREDPSGTYAHMDFESRDLYRKAVEHLAEQSRRTETDVARMAVRTAFEATDDRRRHVGFHLVDRGGEALARRLGVRESPRVRLRRKAVRHATIVFLGAIAVLTAALLGLLAAALHHLEAGVLPLAAALALGLVPAVSVAVTLVYGCVTRLVAPCILPKMDLAAGLPADCKTLVAIPALLVGRGETEALVRGLEIRFLGNRDPHLGFALLTDFTDAPNATEPGDEGLLEQAVEGIRALNRKHGTDGVRPFHLLHRPRSYNESQGCWMGWERKRGKLEKLNEVILGSAVGDVFPVHVGDLELLRQTRFVIVLDADTELPRGAARRLVEAMAHPLNRAEFDEAGRVRAGYTVLQPRVEITPLAADASWFARLISRETGLDPYTRAVSDVYQDLFGEGAFVGKGIYDVAGFQRSVAGRVPESSLLSHDLFEGIHGRAGLASDVVLLEEHPTHYLAHTRRLHRWVRGDWQLLPWLGRRVPLAGGEVAENRLSLLSRWKILDNLRRSLLPPALVGILFAGWLWLPGSPMFWSLLVFLVVASPSLTDLGWRLLRLPGSDSAAVDLRRLWRSLVAAPESWVFELAVLPHQAAVLADAIVRTLGRLRVTGRNLLEWTPAAQTTRALAGARGPWTFWWEMRAGPILSIAVVLALVAWRPSGLVAVTPLLLLWLASPGIAAAASRSRPPDVHELTDEERRRLRLLARRTWGFFEAAVGPDDQWLPPDHVQEDPGPKVARRTSPTNIGLMQLANVCAFDFGYRGLLWTVLRLRNTLDSLDRMERHRGHFLNWYDTATLEPLLPRYVSTVDSGNLVGCLLAVKQSCGAFTAEPVARSQAWEGFLDTLGLLREALGAPDPGAGERHAALLTRIDDVARRVEGWRSKPELWPGALRELLTGACPTIDALLVSYIESRATEVDRSAHMEIRRWSAQVHHHLDRMQRELALSAPWLELLASWPADLGTPAGDGVSAEKIAGLRRRLSRVPSLGEAPEFCGEAMAEIERLCGEIRDDAAPGAAGAILAWLDRLAESLVIAGETARFLLDELQNISRRCDAFFRESDFALLYDARRRLFFIGYDVTEARFDDNYYDLLASEARLASFLAIAKGDVPDEHWLHLGRPIGDAEGNRTLLSWSGTMFEYLMPGLLMREAEGALIGRSCRVAVAAQIAHGRRHGVPWGVSESGYFRFDDQQNYQYQAFGVPGLGFKRGLEDDVVVAPYATVLALGLDTPAVLRNLSALEKLSAVGPHGLYEAIDFTPARIEPGQKYAMVRSYMAHHQGMILAALDNRLHEQVLVRRFHADPLVQTAEMLLCERVDDAAPVEKASVPDTAGAHAEQRRPPLESWRVPADPPFPHAHVLSNGSYSLVVTDGGGGGSRARGLALTRWSADTTLDECGYRTFVRDDRSGARWDLAATAGDPPGRRNVVFHAHQVETTVRAEGVVVHERVAVSPESDVEVRLLEVVSEGNRRRKLTLTSYGEVVLDDPASAARHPAFSRMFVESEFVPEIHALIFHRRPRSAEEKPVFLLHQLVLPESGVRGAGFESARDRFLGRPGGQGAPARERGVDPAAPGTQGNTLDPVMALSAAIDLSPRGTRRLAFVTMVADSREAVLELAARHRSLPGLEWIFDAARHHAEAELERLHLPPRELPRLQRLLSLLLYPHLALRAPPELLARNTLGRSGLWKFGISGDLPILLVVVREAEHAGLVQQVLRAQAFWRGRGIVADVVVLNERASGYSAEVDGRLTKAVVRAGAESWMRRPGGVFLVSADQVGESERALFAAAARVILDGAAGGIAAQLLRLAGSPTRLPALLPSSSPREEVGALPRPEGLLVDNGWGGFTPDGREYVIHLEPGNPTPAPWVNVIANPEFGVLVSESGGGYAWAGNSGENRLIPWSNDPVCDPPGQSIYLRDEETGEIWSPTPLPAPGAGAYQVRHGAGYTEFRHLGHGIEQELRIFVPVDDPLEVLRLRLKNRSGRPRRLTVTFYAEWVLGTIREETQPFVVADFDAESEVLTARNPWNLEFGTAIAFAAASRKLHGFTADRDEFLGRRGLRSSPAALGRIGLANVVRPGSDPCGALQVHVDLAVDADEQVHFLLGQAADRATALDIVKRHRDEGQVDGAWRAVGERWDRLLGAVEVRTPSRVADLMLNRWLPYQSLSSRFWARTGFYQSSGAFGFRDQLQDAAGLVSLAPELCRAHLLECARRQFVEGDVLHWWHPPSGAGVRTRCSDDLLWLPFVAAHYVEATGDRSVLEEIVPYLEASPLASGETDRYGRFPEAGRPGSLYEHCLRAIDLGQTAGPNGLPLIGSGDWNDGLSRVGVGGRGESVWLGWFLCATLVRFATLCRATGDSDRADVLVRRAAGLRTAIEASSWDGAWYRRGFYDDGSPLGSADNDECRIDSLPQSWAVLSGAGDPERVRRAMQSARELLVRPDGLVLLFAPPFDRSAQDPGYVKGYPPGVRENGGQYTHAATWLAWAAAELGDGDLAMSLFEGLLPTHRTGTRSAAALYRVEPYVLAADVAGAPPHTGRGGWTWYTGSAAWAYRVGCEAILGLRPESGGFRIDPCIPAAWPGFEVTLRCGVGVYEIVVLNPRGVCRGVTRVVLDGADLAAPVLPRLEEARTHRVEIHLA